MSILGYDSINKRIVDTVTYINFKDSARLYAKKALDIDANHIRAFSLYSYLLYWEWNKFIDSKNTAPFLAIQYRSEFDKAFSFIVNNSYKFYNIDTSKGKIISQEIIERSYFFIVGSILNFNYKNVDLSNKSKIEYILLLENFTKVLDSSKEFYLLDKVYYNINNLDIKNLISQAKKRLYEIQKKEFEEAELAKNTFTINHDGSRDWDKEATLRSVGEEVWSVCYNNPNAVKIILNISSKE
jgi:hypothetical protein